MDLLETFLFASIRNLRAIFNFRNADAILIDQLNDNFSYYRPIKDVECIQGTRENLDALVDHYNSRNVSCKIQRNGKNYKLSTGCDVDGTICGDESHQK